VAQRKTQSTEMKWNNDLLKFIFSVLAVYLSGLVVYESFLLPKTRIDEHLIHALVVVSEWIIQNLGFVTTAHQTSFFYTIQIENSVGVWVSPNCDGWMVVWVFLSVWIFLPLKNSWKFAMLPLLVLAIEAVNVLRIVSLAIITKYYPQSLAFNHDYTFTILVYGFVIFLWWMGIKRWSNK
jgi:exosortase/archaeosortase family protein